MFVPCTLPGKRLPRHMYWKCNFLQRLFTWILYPVHLAIYQTTNCRRCNCYIDLVQISSLLSKSHARIEKCVQWQVNWKLLRLSDKFELTAVMLYTSQRYFSYSIGHIVKTLSAKSCQCKCWHSTNPTLPSWKLDFNFFL